MLLHVGGKEVHIPAAGRLIAGVLEKPLPDVTRAMRTSHGILGRGIEADAAREIAARIEAGGADVLVISEAECLTLDSSLRMRHAAFDHLGLRCEAYSWDATRQVAAPWDRVPLVSCGRLALPSLTEAPEPEPFPIPFRGITPPPGERLVHSIRYEFVLDIFLMPDGASSEGAEMRGPVPRLRLDQNVAGFSFAEADTAEQSDVPMHRAALQVDRFADGVALNEGLRLLAANAPPAEWESLTFATKADFDLYNLWLLHLIKYGYPLP